MHWLYKLSWCLYVEWRLKDKYFLNGDLFDVRVKYCSVGMTWRFVSLFYSLVRMTWRFVCLCFTPLLDFIWHLQNFSLKNYDLDKHNIHKLPAHINLYVHLYCTRFKTGEKSSPD